MYGLLLPDGVVQQKNSHMKFDSNTLLRIAMKGICNVVNRHIQSGSIIDKDHLQELEQDNIIRWYRTEISKATGHYPKSIPKELKDMCEELIPDLKDKTNKLIFTSKRKARPVRSMKSSEKMLKLYNKSLCKMINYKYIYTRSAGNVAGPHGGIRMFIDGDNHHRHYQESTTLKTINNTKFSYYETY